jgi:hypothetical protein
VNLRGFHPQGDVVDPESAVRGFLEALGLPQERIPDTIDAQTAMYRSLLAGKRVLVARWACITRVHRRLSPGYAVLALVTTS